MAYGQEMLSQPIPVKCLCVARRALPDPNTMPYAAFSLYVALPIPLSSLRGIEVPPLLTDMEAALWKQVKQLSTRPHVTTQGRTSVCQTSYRLFT